MGVPRELSLAEIFQLGYYWETKILLTAVRLDLFSAEFLDPVELLLEFRFGREVPSHLADSARSRAVTLRKRRRVRREGCLAAAGL